MKKNKSLLPVQLYVLIGFISFVTMQLYMYAVYMSTLYALQKHQKQLLFYKEEKEKCLQELSMLQNSTHIKRYAKNVLHMQPLLLEKIKKISLRGE